MLEAWNARWNKDGTHRSRIFLADRFLVDDQDKTFAPFRDARHRIRGGVASKICG